MTHSTTDVTETLRKQTQQFIDDYPHVYYCEIIIAPDGQIIEARPSHIESLVRFYGQPKEIVDQKMPWSDSPLSWLIRKTECVGVWYEIQRLPFKSITPAQGYVLTELSRHGKIQLNTEVVRIQEDVARELGQLRKSRE